MPLDGTGCFLHWAAWLEQVYRGRKPKASPLWQCLSHHFDEFLEAYKERFQPRYGFLRGDAVELIDVSAHEPRRIPSEKWRELIKKVREADPLLCLKCSREMRIVSLIDEEDVIAPLVQRPALRRQLFRVAGASGNPKKPVLDFRAHFCHSAPMAFGFILRANAPEGQKRFPISTNPLR